MNLFYLLATEQGVCDLLEPVMTLFGYVIYGIKVVVPVILIVIGMVELTKAIMGKDDSEIKKAQGSLVKKLVVAVSVYLVITLVGLVMNLLDNPTWDDCMTCAFDPFECSVLNPTAGNNAIINGSNTDSGDDESVTQPGDNN